MNGSAGASGDEGRLLSAGAMDRNRPAETLAEDVLDGSKALVPGGAGADRPIAGNRDESQRARNVCLRTGQFPALRHSGGDRPRVAAHRPEPVCSAGMKDHLSSYTGRHSARRPTSGEPLLPLEHERRRDKAGRFSRFEVVRLREPDVRDARGRRPRRPRPRLNAGNPSQPPGGRKQRQRDQDAQKATSSPARVRRAGGKRAFHRKYS